VSFIQLADFAEIYADTNESIKNINAALNIKPPIDIHVVAKHAPAGQKQRD